jgi:hypothetical protein
MTGTESNKLMTGTEGNERMKMTGTYKELKKKARNSHRYWFRV